MQLDPILTELLRNNELTSEAKRQETIELRSQVNGDLLHIDTEIQRLMAKREQVQKSLDIYNTVLSPARRLLPDILREIFHHCIGETYPILSAKEAPMLLTRVCSQWRSVALSSPRIWTRLHIPLPGNPPISTDYAMNDSQALELCRQVFFKMMQLRRQAVNDWLDRSGSCPLSLSIAYPFDHISRTNIDNDEDDVADPLFQIIHPFAPRLEHLRLSMPLSIYRRLETRVPLHSLSMLQSFTGNILSPGPPLGAASTPIPLHIIELPSLEALSLNFLQFTINLGRYRNSWKHLTNICFGSPVTDTDLLDLLRQCHNLIILDVNMQIPWVRADGRELNLSTVLLPHLKSLKLRETGSSSPAIFAINAPSLKLLQYRCPHRYRASYSPNEPRIYRPESLIWLISNAAASLETLSIDPHTFEQEQVLECLQLAVHVKNLTFGDKSALFPDPEEDIRYHDFFDLEAFSIPIIEYDSCITSNMPLQSQFLLPNLESLEANGGYIIRDEKVYSILTSRIWAARHGMISPLRRVKIQFWRQKEEDIVPEIVAYAREAGMLMKLDFLYRPTGLVNVGPLSPSFLLPLPES